MKFIHNDLGQRKRGDVVEETLSSGANVRLLDSHNLSAYRNGRPHKAVGLATRGRVARSLAAGHRGGRAAGRTVP